MTRYLDDYQTFNSKQELNYNVSQHENAHHDVLNATCRTVLRFIARYSVKYSGASHLKAQTIADGLSVSDRTVRRVLKRLESLNIIRRIQRIRPKTGGQGANIIQILPYVSEGLSEREVDDKARPTSDKADDNEDEPLRKREVPNYILETASAVKNAIPEVIYDTLSPFFNGADLRRLTGVIFRGKSRKVRLEAHTEAFRDVMIDCIRRYKEGDIRSLDGYLYASIRRLSRRLFMTT